MKIDIETEKNIKVYFDQIKDADGLLKLINAVNKKVYHDTTPLKMQSLTYYAYKKKNNYTSFKVPKKSGGFRTINAPVGGLKHIQSSLNIILQSVYKPQMPVHGFRRSRSVVTNAKLHTGKNYVYNIDLKDFFPSIHKARIEKRLQIPPFNLSGEKVEIATLISRLTTQKVFEFTDKNTGEKEVVPAAKALDNTLMLALRSPEILKFKKDVNIGNYKKYAVLPQGAPTSPTISNFICDRLDRRLMGLAKRFNVKYTRYADDITFSSMHNVYQNDSEFIVEMNKIITDQNFEINPKKTRLQKRGYKQEVTGIIVNDKTNVNRHYIKQLRAMLYSIEKHGIEKAQESFIKHYTDDMGHVKKNVPSILNVLSGKLDYLKMVKSAEDSTYKKLRERFELIVTPSEKSIELPDLDIESNKKEFVKNDNLESKEYSTTYSSKKVLKIAKGTSQATPKTICKVHNPKQLVKLLTGFTSNESILKYTTHSWDWGQIEERFTSYDDFMKKVRKEWDKLSPEIRKVAPKLHGKLYGFLINDKLGEYIVNTKKEKELQRWGINRITFGWSSKDLKGWCSNNTNIPFKMPLSDKYQKEIGAQSLQTFGDIVVQFKKEIEIVEKNNQLKEIFTEMQEYLGFDFEFDLDGLKSLEGITFYTDVQWFVTGINQIFEEIKGRPSHPQIIVRAEKFFSEGFIEIRITQKGSVTSKEVDEMVAETKDGHFGEVLKAFCSLCDWRIESKFVDGNYKINFLSSVENATIVEPLEYEPEGFTHILRFYK